MIQLFPLIIIVKAMHSEEIAPMEVSASKSTKPSAVAVL
jgi:hypothetical protein